MKDQSSAGPPAAGSPEGRNPLVGAWKKVTRDARAEKYPDQIQFFESGLYSGKSDETSQSLCHPLWDAAGSFKVVGPGEVRLSTSDDDRILYPFTATPDTLTFEDPDGLVFEYRRAAP